LCLSAIASILSSAFPNISIGTEIPVYGQQEQSAYNEHFGCTCYHPLLLFNRKGEWSRGQAAARQSTAPLAAKNCCCSKSSGNRS
jgi:hypothetical protein